MKKQGSTRHSTHRHRSVQFSSNVSMRCFFAPQQSSPTITSWTKVEVEENKSRAKKLSKLHLHLRAKLHNSASNTTSTPSSSSTASTGNLPTSSIHDVTRYRIKGESLRGMEYITDVTNGKVRRRRVEEAMSAVATEQQEQLIQRVLTLYTSSNQEDQEANDVMKMDTGRIAKAYSTKARNALVYAQQVAEEDAKIASQILKEDLSCKMKSTMTAMPMKLAMMANGTVIFKSLLLPKTPRHRNVASAQA